MMSISNNEWLQYGNKIIEQMIPYLQESVTPIGIEKGKDENSKYFELHGSGTYIQYGERIFLLTNEHVGRSISTVPFLIS